jgi:radical SAM superfamily enzyme YgiQ (UPF0313 family)
VQFIDDTFNVPPKRFKEILRMMIKNRYRFQWHSHFRCQFLDGEMIELMKESGCAGVFLGIESGNNQILKNMNKSVTIEEYLTGISLLKENDILTNGSFIIGFPGETHHTVRDTVQFIKESGIDFYRAQLWYCDPVTPIWQQREKYHIKGESFEWRHHTMDSREAADLIDEIFLSVDEPIWVPQFNFEFDAVFQLMERNISLEQIKQFIKTFNKGVKIKLQDTGQKEIDFDIIRQLKKACQPNHSFKEPITTGKKKNRKYQAEFDF